MGLEVLGAMEAALAGPVIVAAGQALLATEYRSPLRRPRLREWDGPPACTHDGTGSLL
jgi:hypothetical protein